jgi:hypothetical protein
MSADGKPPAKRPPSQSDRDAQGFAARKERDRAADAAIPASVEEELTGNYKGEELERRRALRPTDQRVAHLETRVDGVISDIGEMRAEVASGMGKIVGSVGELAGEVKGLAMVVANQGQREHATYKATLEIDTAEKKAEVEVDTATKKAEVEVYTAKEKDEIDAKKESRSRTTKIIAGVIALLTSGTFLGWLLGKL